METGIVTHVTVATEALWAAQDGRLSGSGGDLLRGLGYVTLDRGAADAVRRALSAWAVVQPVPLGPSGVLPPLPAVAVPAAYVAVQEYGQRLAYALHGFELKETAESNAPFWNLTIGLATGLVPGVYGVAAGVIEGYAAMWLGMDGTWDNGPDRGLHLDRSDAVTRAVRPLPDGQARAARRVAEQAAGAYEVTARSLGLPKPPTSPVNHWWQPLADALTPGPDGLLKDARHLDAHLKNGRTAETAFLSGS
jgi:hypothetical protein